MGAVLLTAVGLRGFDWGVKPTNTSESRLIKWQTEKVQRLSTDKMRIEDRLATLSDAVKTGIHGAGDGLADRLIMETAVYLAIGTVNIMHTLNPAMVLFGGAMTFDQHESDLGRRFIAKVQSEVKARAFPIPAQRTIIDYASLGGDAGFIGSAGCIRNHLHRLQD